MIVERPAKLAGKASVPAGNLSLVPVALPGTERRMG